MIATILAAVGLVRSTTTVKPAQVRIRRARWRGSDGRWQWAAV
jgi:hypothetical protein